MDMHLGIEIGGTKLQLGVGHGRSAHIDDMVRTNVDVAAGAEGIVRQIETIGTELCEKFEIASIGVGFGGPVNVATGQVTKSHQVSGWDGFPLGQRLRARFDRPVCVDNDCNAAALGEARLGAGKSSERVFYVTVGSGIGGGFVVSGQLDGNHRPAISEIGHLRPGLAASNTSDTVESLASGWGIATQTRRHIAAAMANGSPDRDLQELLEKCNHQPESLTTQQIGEAAGEGNAFAKSEIEAAARCLGWAVAQVISLLAPEMVVIGGGVSLLGNLFLDPVRRATEAYVFPPLLHSYAIEPAALGEEVVVHGAIQLAVSTPR